MYVYTHIWLNYQLLHPFHLKNSCDHTTSYRDDSPYIHHHCSDVTYETIPSDGIEIFRPGPAQNTSQCKPRRTIQQTTRLTYQYTIRKHRIFMKI